MTASARCMGMSKKAPGFLCRAGGRRIVGAAPSTGRLRTACAMSVGLDRAAAATWAGPAAGARAGTSFPGEEPPLGAGP